MELPIRKPTRLKNYDYSTPGMYFVTVCVDKKAHLLGKIKNNCMNLSSVGEVVNQEILNIESHYENVSVEKYVIMPNHIHLIISISEMERINPFSTKNFDVSNVIGKFKAGVTRNVGNAFMHSDKKIFQRSFHDHIIRDKNDYSKIWEYIDTNVSKWESDCFYTDSE